MQPYVLGFAFRHDKSGSLLLIEKQHPEYQKGKYNGIGGKIEKDELPIYAMEREFLEETGVVIPAWKWKGFGTIGGDEWLIYLFVSSTWEVDGFKTMTDEKVAMFHKDNLPENIMHNLPWLIPMAYGALHNGLDLAYDVEELP